MTFKKKKRCLLLFSMFWRESYHAFFVAFQSVIKLEQAVKQLCDVFELLHVRT